MHFNRNVDGTRLLDNVSPIIKCLLTDVGSWVIDRGSSLFSSSFFLIAPDRCTPPGPGGPQSID